MTLLRSSLVLLLSAPFLFAKPPAVLAKSDIRHWGASQGLPEETIYSISETSDGFLWLASRDGLIRFDGLNFRVFNPGETSGYRDNGMGATLAAGGRLWAVSVGYIAYAVPDAFQSFTNPSFFAAPLGSVSKDRNGSTGLQGLSDGTTLLRRADGVYRVQLQVQGAPPSVPQLYLPAPDGRPMTSFHHGPSGRDWASTLSGVYLRRQDQWVALPGAMVEAATVLESKDGTLWSYSSHGLFRYSGGAFHPVPLPGRVTPDTGRALMQDTSGDIWVGLVGGVARVRGAQIELLRLGETMRSGDFVKTIAESRDGALWAATNWGSLVRIDSPVFHTIGAAEGLPEVASAAVTQDSSGRTCVGTRAKGTYCENAGTFSLRPGTEREGVLHAFANLGDGRLLLANVSGLWLSTPTSATLLATAPSREMSDYRAFSPNYGTHIYYNDSQVIYRIPLPLSASPAPKFRKVASVPLARSILEGSDGLWAVSWNRGLYHIGEDGSTAQFPLDPRRDLRAFTLFELSPDFFLVGSDAGVFTFDRKRRRFLDRPPLFGRDQIFQIVSDGNSHIWFAGRRALLAANRTALLLHAEGRDETVLPLRLTSQQGLSSTNFGLGTSSASFLDSDNEMWLASLGGLIHFRPRRVVGMEEQIPCAISQVVVDGSELPVSSVLKLPPGGRRLEIRYTVLNRKADRNPLFRYRLEGDSSSWVETSLPQADFTNLSPGAYSFQVQARLSSIAWSPAASMALIVEPQWFQQTGVRLAAIALFLFLIYFTIQFRERQINARNLELEARVQARTEELAHARDGAEAAARAKSDFLASMSHEIRTPMNGVIGMVEVLKQTPLTAEQRHLLAVVSESGDALIGILNDILDFSKIEAGALTLEVAPFSLRDLVLQCHELFLPGASSKSLAFDVSIDEDVPPHVLGDATRLRQILLNLLSNAVKFTPRGRVSLAVKRGEQENVSFRVVDTGIGIPAGKLPSIFEVFTQAETSTTRRFGGTGLGLAICRRLAEAMRGDLAVRSESDKGSVFTLTLPLPAASAPVCAEPLVGRPSRAGALPPRVLVVEDNAVNREVATRLLAKLGCEVTLAHDGVQALEAVGLEPFDVILMDCHMPGMDGYEATRQIRMRFQSDFQVPIVALTASAMAEDRLRCADAGMNGFLSKPIRIDDLRRIVDALPPRQAG